VDGDLEVGTDYDGLTIEVAAQDGNTIATEAVPATELHLPFSVNFISGKETPAGARVTVTATALLGPLVVARQSAPGTLALKDADTVTLQLVHPPRGDGGTVDGG